MQDMKMQDMKMQDMKLQDMKLQDMKLQDNIVLGLHYISMNCVCHVLHFHVLGETMKHSDRR